MEVKLVMNSTVMHISGDVGNSIVEWLVALFRVDIKAAEEMATRYYIDQFKKLDEIKTIPKYDLVPILVALDSISDDIKNAINDKPNAKEYWEKYNRLRDYLKTLILKK